MRAGNRTNALLVELMVVVMFFMLTTSVLLQVFAKARQMSRRSELITNSLVKAQNIADQLYAADDIETLLTELGFIREGEEWLLTDENTQFAVSTTAEADDAGLFRRQELRVITEGETLFTLPCSRWEALP